MKNERPPQPFKNLGLRLKVIRQKLQQSVAEVSGAVEIDEPTLERIEQGRERPSEDILMLLISHFGMKDDEAAGLWQLAGYDQPHDRDDSTEENAPINNRAMVMIMALDPRVLFSDGVQINANRNGVTLNFTQATGTPQSLTAARIGMSREQAQNVVRVLAEALHYSEPTPKQLPDGQDKTDK